MSATRPIPGIRFIASVDRAPALGDLPRMDAAGFVGYARSGPVDVPVLIEDPLRFRDVFGADLELAVDDGGLPVTSQLGPAVEAFFANEGAQCFVVRVAGGAATTAFPAPGLVDPVSGPAPASWRGVQLAARSPGAAFDDLQVAARLAEAGRLGIADVDLDAAELLVRTRTAIPPGALLECAFDDGAVQLWLTVASSRRDAGGRLRVGWNAGDECWWRQPPERVLPAGSATVVAAASRPALAYSAGELTADGRLRLRAPGPVAELVALGAVLVIDLAGVRIAAAARSVAPVPAVETTWELTCWPVRSLLTRDEGRTRPAAVQAPARVLELELAAGRAGVPVASVGTLGLRLDHPRWHGHLPDDHALFDREHRRRANGGEHPPPGPLDAPVMHPRFALAAVATTPAAVLPLGLGESLTPWCPALPESTTRGDREGLAVHEAAHFLDAALAGLGPDTLLAAARHRFYVQGRGLRGLHALLPVDEAAVAAVPDAVQPTWRTRTIPGEKALDAPRLVTDGLPAELAWTAPWRTEPDRYELVVSSSLADFTPAQRFNLAGDVRAWPVTGAVCERVWIRVRAWWGGRGSPWSSTVGVDLPASGTFSACASAIRRAPELRGTPTGVAWQAIDGAAGYDVQIGRHTALDGAPIVRTDATSHPVARGPAAVYVRARARLADDVAAPWSNTVGFDALSAERRETAAPGAAPHRPAIDLHDALGLIAAARRDLIGLVSFPSWYAIEDVEEHVAALVDPSSLPGLQPTLDRSVLLAHLVAAHPWAYLPAPPGRGDTLRATPLDGTLAGRLGRTALTRGAWIAGVSAPLNHVLGPVRPPGDDERRRLVELQVNAVVGRDGGSAIAGIDTLVDDPAIRPWTVRRLLILIRRLAQREGESALFDPHGPELRRLVVTRFEQLLGLLFRLGGFAGATPDEAFRVLCGESLNPPASVDAGRLVVELQVAPSMPLEFVIVRLVQTGASTVLEAA